MSEKPVKFYRAWERYWIDEKGDPNSEERLRNGDLRALTVRARAFEQAMQQPLVSRCSRCRRVWRGPAGVVLERFKTHECRKAKA